MSPCWLLFYFYKSPHSIVSFPHIIHNLEQPGRSKRLRPLKFKRGIFSIALAGRKKRDAALMYPWLPWLYCCLSWAADAIKVLGEKWPGKECNCRRGHHMQVFTGHREVGIDPKRSLLSWIFQAIWFIWVSLAMIGRPLDVPAQDIIFKFSN